MIIDTLHPVHEGTVFRWRNDDVEETAADPSMAAPPRRGRRILAAQSVLPPAADRRGGIAPAHRLRRADRLHRHPGDEGCRAHRLRHLRPSLCARATIGEMDCVYSAWSTRHADGLQRCRYRGPAPPGAGPGARDQERSAGQGRRHAGPGLSRPRCRPARSEGPHPARRRRSHRGGAVVLRPAQLHHHHRHRQADRDHPSAERLCRGGHHRHPRGRRRRAEADRRRHAGAVPRRRSVRGLPPRAQAEEIARGRVARIEREAPGRGTAGHRRSMSACMSARCSTAISAASTGSTSPSSVRRSTRPAASPRCAARSTGRS